MKLKVNKKKTKQLFIFVPLFILALIFQRWLEHQNMVDSIGWWYTILCALFYSGIVFGVVTGLGYVLKSK